MIRALLTLAVLGGSGVLVLLMLRGWRGRQRRQADLPPLPTLPADEPEPLLPPVEGLYVGTTTAGRWLDRVVVHGLSDRAAAEMALAVDGLRIDREGAPTLFVPASAVRDARVDSALSGTVVGSGGLLVVTWEHGDVLLDTGFRADDRDAHPAYARVLRRLAVPAGDGPVEAPASEPGDGTAEPHAVLSPAVPSPAASSPAVPSPTDPTDPVTDPAGWTVPEPRGGQPTAPVPIAERPPTDPVEPPLGPPLEVPPAPVADEIVFTVGPPPGMADERFDPAPSDLPTVTDTDVFSWGPLPVSESAVAPPSGDPAPHPRIPALVGLARPPAVLALEDGRLFTGTAYGAVGTTFGEAVFNTGMTGYQETLTDPSYHRQVVVMTAPHIGNTGVNDEDPESDRIWVSGYVVRDPSRVASSWRAQRSLDDELRAQGVVGISGLDTRALTRHLRERGAMRVGIASDGTDVDTLLDQVLASPTMAGSDLARDVSTTEAYVVRPEGRPRYRVAALDLGLKRATPARMAALGCEVHVLPAGSTSDDLLAVEPDGVFFSNGPGDPATCDYAVAAMQGVLDEGVAVFGICFGNQILGRALGLGTYKLDYGHRGVNQPVMDRATGQVAVTSHNHGFAVAAPLDRRVDTPYGEVEVSHVGLNDQVVEGLRCHDVPAFSVQYHPEAAPGPHDASGLFDQFCALMDETRVG